MQQQGLLPETLALHPANIYGQYKLEAEQRVLELCPDSVHLRAVGCMTLPGFYGLPIRGNLPLSSALPPLKGNSALLPERPPRPYVRQVIENLEPAMALPGGVYNFGSGNAENMVCTARQFAETLGIAEEICRLRKKAGAGTLWSGHHKTETLRHPVRHHSAGHPALFKRLRAENAVKFPYRTKIK